MSLNIASETLAFAGSQSDLSALGTTTVAAGGHHAEGNPLLSLDPGVAIWTLVTFFLLLLVLRLFAWKPIIKSLDDREKFLASAHEDAVQARNEAKKIAEEQSKILTEARKQASNITEEAVKKASDHAKVLEQSAIKEKNNIIDSAYKEAEQIKSQAISQNKETIVKLAMTATEKLIQETIDEAKSKEILEKYIEGFKA